MGVPRGIRNHNPGNLREAPGDKTQWVGERATDDDPVFEEFDSPVYGLRALAKTLMTYQAKYHLITVTQIIERFAPKCENPTANYALHVVKYTGSDFVNLNEDATLIKMLRGIVSFENGTLPNGQDWYADETYQMAVRLARE